jgi:hypothetical protein
VTGVRRDDKQAKWSTYCDGSANRKSAHFGGDHPAIDLLDADAHPIEGWLGNNRICTFVALAVDRYVDGNELPGHSNAEVMIRFQLNRDCARGFLPALHHASVINHNRFLNSLLSMTSRNSIHQRLGRFT